MAVAIYARVSTVRQALADLSIPDQINQMRDWCQREGMTVAREYIEPGASAMDDRRPMFLQMVEDATRKPYPFEAIIVHSRSRFFRDMYGALHYERLLTKAGVRVISITQPTTDDASGELLRNVISMMDGYSSKENAKHTSRSMKENARRGFFNGSRAPYGYCVVPTDIPGHKGKTRKKLEVDELEARVVKEIYRLYIHGHNGHPMGMKAIAQHLNESGQLMRGRPWRIQKMHDILSDETYRGEYRYNMRDSRTGLIRPESEWIRCQVEPIIDEATFDAARRIRESRAVKGENESGRAKASTSPTLLTGLLTCSQCGKAMTLATGKSGRYKYYKCCSRIAIGRDACSTPNLPMDKMDSLVLERIVSKLLTPERVTPLLKDWLRQKGQQQTNAQSELDGMNRALRTIEDRLNNLYAAVESGMMTLDSTLQRRVQELRDQREKLMAEMALIQRQRPTARNVSPKQVEYACRRMRELLLDSTLGYGKQLLTLLVSEIRVAPGTVEMSGSVEALNSAVSEMKMGTSLEEVPSFISDWRARSDSNARPLGS